jgi:hypothetical protein
MDAAQSAWAALRRYHDSSYVAHSLMNLHNLGDGQKQNALKQATQIKYCLMQAKEYFDASKEVSLATQPVLLYYAMMCLALAETLFKQDGNSSLDRAREQNRHHGLILDAVQKPTIEGDLAVRAGSLRAAPLEIKEIRSGTFELWHRGAREDPLVGEMQRQVSEGGSTTRVEILAGSSEGRLPLMPATGLSLLDCLTRLPDMLEPINQLDTSSNVVRAKASGKLWANGAGEFSLIIHPTRTDNYEKLLQNIKVNPNDSHLVDQKEVGSNGCVIVFSMDSGQLPRFKIPACSVWRDSELRLWPEDQSLNEFGFYYVALFICGNYARYYPDFWMRDIEVSSSLALVVESLVDSAQRRLPLLSLAQLSRTAICLPS